MFTDAFLYLKWNIFSPMSRSILCVSASMPELSKRLRLLDPCFRDNMCIMDRRKRACGIVPRLGPAGFSFVIVCRGTGCTPVHKQLETNQYVCATFSMILHWCDIMLTLTIEQASHQAL